jgi:hypothetical protein
MRPPLTYDHCESKNQIVKEHQDVHPVSTNLGPEPYWERNRPLGTETILGNRTVLWNRNTRGGKYSEGE